MAEMMPLVPASLFKCIVATLDDLGASSDRLLALMGRVEASLSSEPSAASVSICSTHGRATEGTTGKRAPRRAQASPALIAPT